MRVDAKDEQATIARDGQRLQYAGPRRADSWDGQWRNGYPLLSVAACEYLLTVEIGGDLFRCQRVDMPESGN